MSFVKAKEHVSRGVISNKHLTNSYNLSEISIHFPEIVHFTSKTSQYPLPHIKITNFLYWN